MMTTIGLMLGALLGILLLVHSLRMIAYALDPQRLTEKRMDEFVRR